MWSMGVEYGCGVWVISCAHDETPVSLSRGVSTVKFLSSEVYTPRTISGPLLVFVLCTLYWSVLNLPFRVCCLWSWVLIYMEMDTMALAAEREREREHPTDSSALPRPATRGVEPSWSPHERDPTLHTDPFTDRIRLH